MERHSRLDRLLYLICTGGGGSGAAMSLLKEKMGLSQAALHVLRTTLDTTITNQILLHTLVPPIIFAVFFGFATQKSKAVLT